VNIERVKRKVDFEVIEIIDDFYPYHALLGIDWACYHTICTRPKPKESETILA
jgi:hypothetical protein